MLETTRLFTEALNARDLETMRALVADDVEFRTRDGRALKGYDGLDVVVKAVLDTDLLLARRGAERQGDGSGRVTVPMRVLVGKNELSGTAVFEGSDGKVGLFSLTTD